MFLLLNHFASVSFGRLSSVFDTGRCYNFILIYASGLYHSSILETLFGFNYTHDNCTILDYTEAVTPMRQNVTIEQVGNVSAFLCSDLAAGVTGEVVHVDMGYHVVGLA